MKKYILLLLILLLTNVAYSQEFQCQVSQNSYKLAIEHMEISNKHLFYMYEELYDGADNWLYSQLFYEYNIVGMLSSHIEYRNMIYEKSVLQHIFMAGLSLSLYNNDYCYFGLSALYRYENAHLWHFSPIYGASYKIITFDGYMDFYGNRNLCIFSENKLKLHFNKVFIGCNLEFIFADKASYLTPYIMFGLKL